MAAPTSSGSAAGAHGGSSAPVLEYLCLFTHDLKRKQKRWQDGRLKYHTFNNRIMVYDDRGNFVGDMHWRHGGELDEGEELELERGCVIVQVAECVGRQNQDLSELIDKRAREKEERKAKVASRPPIPVPMHTPLSIHRRSAAQDTPQPQPRHRPLNQLLGTPSGHHGRAVVPTESPFEQRHKDGETPTGQKRKRFNDTPPSKMGYAQSLFGASLSLSGAPMSSVPPRRPPASRPQTRHPTSSPEEEVQAPKPGDGDDQAPSTPNRHLNLPTVTRPAGPSHRLPGPRGEPVVACRPQAVEATKSMEDLRVASKRLGVVELDAEALGQEGSADKSRTSNAANPSGRVSRNVKPTDGLRTRNSSATIRPIRANTTASRNDQNQISDPSALQQVIVLDDDTEGEGEGNNALAARVSKSKAIGAKRVAVDTPKSRSPKRKKITPVDISPPFKETGPEEVAIPHRDTDGSPETHQQEPRTELKLKSRQKRGLLVASEVSKKRPRVKGPKSSDKEVTLVVPDENNSNASRKESMQADIGQDQPPSEGDDPFASSPPAHQETGADILPSLSNQRGKPHQSKRGRVHPDPVLPEQPSLPHIIEDDDPFLSSVPVVQEIGTSSPPRRQRKTSKPQKNVAHPDGPPQPALANTTQNTVRRGRANANRPEKANSDYDLPGSAEDELTTQDLGKTPSPQTKRAEERKTTGTETTEGDAEQSKNSSMDHDASATNKREPSRRLRSARELREKSMHHFSGQDISSSESSADEEMPEVPVGPRLARLARKGLKSREVIGFVMSSSQVHALSGPTFRPGLPVGGCLTQVRKDTALTCDVENLSAPSLAERSGSEAPPIALMKDKTAQPGKDSAPGAMLKNDTGFVTVIGEKQLETGEMTTLWAGSRPKSLALANSGVVQDERNPSPTSFVEKGIAPVTTKEPNEFVEQPTKEGGIVDRPGFRTLTHTIASTVLHGPASPGRDGSFPEIEHSEIAASRENKVAEARSCTGSPYHQQECRQGLSRCESTVNIAESDGGHVDISALQPRVAPRGEAVVTRTAQLDLDLKPTSHEAPDQPHDQPGPHKRAISTAERPAAASAGLIRTSVDITNSRSKLVNPATRGRKAALRSHAAGQTPQPILPPVEHVPVRLGQQATEAARPSAGANERPKRKMMFPGFASVKETSLLDGLELDKEGPPLDGPWSREAYDLLETGRRPGG